MVLFCTRLLHRFVRLYIYGPTVHYFRLLSLSLKSFTFHLLLLLLLKAYVRTCQFGGRVVLNNNASRGDGGKCAVRGESDNILRLHSQT